MAVNINRGGLSFTATLDGRSQFRRDVDGIRQDVARFNGDVRDAGTQIEGMFKKATLAATSFFTIQAGTNFVNQLINVRGEFQKLEVAYTTMLGSKKEADALMAETIALAATTPFNLTDVAQSTKQLLAYGVAAEDVTGTLRMLGNIAAGVSQPIGDIAYLYGTLKTQGRAYAMDIRQFTGRGIPIIAELAKQFHVTEGEVNKLVEAGKVGFPQVEKAFESMTGKGGKFFNLMEEQSKTLSGRISNLQDAFASMLNEIGKSNEGLLNNGISAVAYLVENYDQMLTVIGQLIAVYGAYRAAVITTTAVEAVQEAIILRQALATTGLTSAQALLSISTQAVQSSMSKLSSALSTLTNPYVALAVALGAMTAAFIGLKRETDYAAKASAQMTEEVAKEQTAVGILFDKLQTTTAGTKERKAAVDELTGAYGDYLPKMNLERASLKQLEDAYARVNLKIEENIGLKVKQQQSDALSADFAKEQSRLVSDILQQVADETSDLQAGKANNRLNKLIASARAGKIRLGPGNNYGDQAERDVLQGTKYVQELTGGKQSISLSNYLNSLQTSIDAQRKAIHGLNEFNAGNDKAKEAGEKLTKAQQEELARVTRFNENIKAPYRKFNQLIKDARGEEDFKKVLAGLEAERTKLTATLVPDQKQIDNINGRITKLRGVLKRYDEKTLIKESNLQQKELDDRKKIYDQLGSLHEDNLANAKTQDQKEIDQVKQKYKDILAVIDDYNKKHKLKINPKNIKLDNGQVINIAAEEAAAINNVKAKQVAEQQKPILDAQKQLYKQYEDYKTQYSEEAAQARFGKDLKGYTTYIEYLQGLIKGLDGKTDAGSNALRDFYNSALPAAQKEANEKVYDDQMELLKRTASFNERLINLDKTYKKEREALIAAGKTENVEQLDAEYQRKKTELGNANVEAMNAFQMLFDGVTNLTRVEAEKAINIVHEYLSQALQAGKITKKTFDQMEARLNDAGQNVKSKFPENLKTIASNFSGIAGEVGALDENLGKALGTLSGMLDLTANLKSNFDQFKSIQETFKKTGKTDLLGSFTSGLGMLGAGLGVVSMVSGLFSAAKQREEAQRKYQADLQMKQIDAINKALERQLALTQEIYGPERLLAYKKNILDIKKATEETRAQIDGMISLTGNKALDENIAKYNRGEKYNDFMVLTPKKLEELKATNTLVGKTVEQLQDMLNSGKLDEKTSKLVESLIELEKQAKETANALKAEVTGTNFDSLKDAIASLFENGEASAENIGKALQKSIDTAMIQSFKRNQLEKAMQPFFDLLYESGKNDDKVFDANGNLLSDYTQAELDALKALKDSTTKGIEKQGEILKGLFGTTTDAQNSLQGSLKASLTEDTGGLLLGQFQGQRMATLQLVGINTQQLQEIQAIMAINQQLWQQNADAFVYWVKIEENTRIMADNSKELSRLANIERALNTLNTKINSNAAGLAANGFGS